MFKKILTVLIFLAACSAHAQVSRSAADRITAQDKCSLQEPAPSLPAALLNHRRIASGAEHAVTTVAQLGSAANANGMQGGGKSDLWYDKNIHTIVFTHRSNGDPTTGYYRYDMSTDGGINWLNDRGPVYSNPNDSVRARFPLGLIYNPASNTNPANAYMAYAGPWTGGSGFKGRVYGTGKLDQSAATQHYEKFNYTAWPLNMFVVKATGDVWIINGMYDNDSLNTGMDTIIISRGIWNSSTLDFDYTDNKFPCPFNNSTGRGRPIDIDIAFNDAGTIGYITMIRSTDEAAVIYPDSLFFLSVLKSTDGGSSWNFANNCSFHPEIIDVSRALDSLLANDTSTYMTAFDLDVVVDINSNLHILTSVHPGGGFAIVGDAAPGVWGMFDIYTEDMGASWKAQILGKPISFRGKFGDGTTQDPFLEEDLRPFASRSWDGTKLFFGWFETDTIIWGVDPNTPKRNNRNPDLHAIAFDVTTGLWTDTINLTRGGDADGQCTFGTGSYYVIDSASGTNVFSIPMVYQQLADPQQTGSPVSFQFVQNANMDMTTATRAGNPVLLPCAPEQVTVRNQQAHFNVSANYPNPFSGKTQIDISLETAGDVTVEVVNLPGQVMRVDSYSKLSSGFHTLTIDGSQLTPGIYFYKVDAGSNSVVRKFIVQ